MICTIKIMAWNCNGLLQHQNELQVVLDIENIDVCLVSETHFTKQSHIEFKGYKIYHALHPANKGRGGSAVIVKESTKHYEESKFEETEFQSVSIHIDTKQYPLTVAAIYCPPRHTIQKDTYKSLLQQLGERFILGGDFNAKNIYWGSRLTNIKGKELLGAIKETNCEVVSSRSPTYWPTDPLKIPDLIDFFIYKNISANYFKIDQSYDLNSDHSALYLEINDKILLKDNTPALVNKYTDWESFKTEIQLNINLKVPLKTPEDLNIEVEQFITLVQQIAWKNTPEIKKKISKNNYPKEIKTLISDKRKQRKRWHQSRCPQDKQKLNNLTKQLKKEIQSFIESTTTSYLQKLTNDRKTDYSLWKATKNMKRPMTQIPPLKDDNGKWAVSNEDKAKRFAEHLEKIFTPNEGPTHNLEVTVYDVSEEETYIPPVSPREVQSEIYKNINPKKSPGFDLISGEILHNLPKKAIVKLTNIINAALRLKYVPELWKVAEIIMIAKPGKSPHDVKSYRPISLLPIISKLFEKLLFKRLKPVIDAKNLIPEHQFGFREKHSTIDQVHRITNVIEKTLENKNVCATIFLDVAQAFDKVWHEGLILKLNKSLPKPYVDILKSYISERVFRVRQEDAYSEIKEIKAGVPQGSVLGPVLYLLYTSDIPELKNNTIATFADDTAIMAVGNTHAEAAEKVQSGVNKVYDWTKKWRINLNESKSIHINFTNKKEEYHPVYINHKLIPYENTAKYLGMTLDAKLRWKAHVKKKREELELRYRQLYWLLGSKSALSVQNKIILYKQVLMPVWTYGIQLWGCTKKSNILTIQRFQNKVLRVIVNAPWYVRNEDLHRDLKIDFVNKIIKKYAEVHEKRLHQHVNIEAIQLLDNTDLVRRLKRTKPFELV